MKKRAIFILQNLTYLFHSNEFNLNDFLIYIIIPCFVKPVFIRLGIFFLSLF